MVSALVADCNCRSVPSISKRPLTVQNLMKIMRYSKPQSHYFQFSKRLEEVNGTALLPSSAQSYHFKYYDYYCTTHPLHTSPHYLRSPRFPISRTPCGSIKTRHDNGRSCCTSPATTTSSFVVYTDYRHFTARGRFTRWGQYFDIPVIR